MNKKLILVMSAILLTFGIISCDTPTTTLPPLPVPLGLVGEYTAGEHTVILPGTGAGSVNGEDARFSVVGNVLTVTADDQSITVSFEFYATPPPFGAVAFSSPAAVTGPADGLLMEVFTAFAEEGHIVRLPIGFPPDVGIPAELVGYWAVDREVTGSFMDFPFTVPANSRIFVINSDGTGSARNSFFHNDDDAVWSVRGNRITLAIVAGPASGAVATFDWEITGGNLWLSNPTGDEGLAGFADFSPFVGGSVDAPPSPSELIDAVDWAPTIREEFTGTWTTTVPLFSGRKVFAIRADGTGYVYRSTTPGFYPATYRLSQGATATSGKLLLTIAGFGRVMYTVTIANGQLTLSEPVIDGPIALGTYGDFFNPFTRTPESELPIELPFDYSSFEWLPVIPPTHTGTWNFLGLYFPDVINLPPIPNVYTINFDGTGTVFINMAPLPNIYASPAYFALCVDEEHLLITIPLLGGRALFEVSNPVDGMLVLTNPIPDAGGEVIAVGYGWIPSLTRN